MAHQILDLKLNTPSTVRYGSAFGSEEFKLLEVDESVLQEILLNGVTIRGAPDDEAVLCTSKTTYAIKFVSTSNTVLLIPPNDLINGVKEDTIDASATVTGHLELAEVAPLLDKLKALLSKRPYTEDQDWETEPGGHDNDLYSWYDLLDNVQASEEQLKEALRDLAAVEINGYWRILDPKLMQSLLEMIILNSVQHEWPLDRIPIDEVVYVMEGDGYLPNLVRHCLTTYGHLADSSEINIWALDEKQVCLQFARQLLLGASKWRVKDFIDTWQQKLPSGLNCNIDWLQGEALIEKLGSESWIRPYSISSLPKKPAARFAALFQEKSKWEWQELEPYLRDLHVPGQSVEAMLLRYTRKIQPTADAPLVYTAR